MSDTAYQFRKRDRLALPTALRLPQQAIAASSTYVLQPTSPWQGDLDVMVVGQGGQAIDAISIGGQVGIRTPGAITLCNGSTALVSAWTATAGSNTLVTILYTGGSNDTVSGVTAGTIFGTAAIVAAPPSGVGVMHDVARGNAAGTLPALDNADPFASYSAKFGHANWDGYGAIAIEPATIGAARSFMGILPTALGPPDVAPGADGTVGLEWAFPDRPVRKLFIDIGPGNVWTGYWRRASGERCSLPRRIIDATTSNVLAELFDSLNA